MLLCGCTTPFQGTGPVRFRQRDTKMESETQFACVLRVARRQRISSPQLTVVLSHFTASTSKVKFVVPSARLSNQFTRWISASSKGDAPALHSLGVARLWSSRCKPR
ncbi:hypothetical protein EJ02DRAFT_342192 [Clathrospora elynae]|uniref:Uncharacterized protein n=1 Tax=Clathrospora elynae TaxID=706981 RepID=A0A6A5SVN8_9PLEO|nr:hypothetical protein EJ02DRAFT_342192 [Clathrospora elynae]